jgi:hypothetical protein
MKTTIIVLATSIFLFASCGDDKSSQLTQSENTGSDKKMDTEVEASRAPGSDITGTWKLFLEAYDANRNEVLDEEEKKTDSRNNYMFHFNADGSCKIQSSLKGSYTIKDEGGKKILLVQRQRIEGAETEDPAPDWYLIKSLSDKEMLLLTGSAEFHEIFWLFKKV